MSFYSLAFEFAGKASEDYGITISSTNSGEESTDGIGGVKLYTERLFRRTDEFLIGTSIEKSLEFPVSFTTSDTELTARDAAVISKWLFGRSNYSKLKVMQPDMTEIVYDCFMIEPTILRIGSIIRGFSAKVHCKHPWGMTEAKSTTYSGVGSFTHNNMSDNSGFTYPVLTITMSVLGGGVSITNNSDIASTILVPTPASRESVFNTLLSNEVITLDNSLQVVTSSSGLNRLSKFNKVFFRLKQGVNNLVISGNVSTIKIAYPLARKIGG